MSRLAIDYDKCILCGQCVEACPFSALELKDRLEVNENCRLCGICVKTCPVDALAIQRGARATADLDSYQGILVFAEQRGGILASVVKELIGKGRELADKLGQKLYVVLPGKDVDPLIEILKQYPVDAIYAYDHPELSYYRAETYTAVLEDLIQDIKPGILLVGATQVGRSLAPRVATRLRTGLTADCTILDVKPNGDLIQTRPAFGGNVMAQIITPKHRPQLATVRPKVMAPSETALDYPTEVIKRKVKPEMLKSRTEFLSIEPKPQETSITEAEVIVAVGRGLKKAEDMALVEDLAKKLNGMVAVTRPLVEAGWASYTQQVGLSGRTVRPKLFIACGISGAIQHVAGMSSSEVIFAINKDPDAPIFQVAHYGLVGDLYEILPALIEELDALKTGSK